jgi:hypothetical protein
MQKHILAVGILHIGLGLMRFCTAPIILAILFFSGILKDQQNVFNIFAIVTAVISLVNMLFALPQIIGGFGLIKHYKWSRYLIILISVINLFSIPIGILIGLYSLVILFLPKTAYIFSYPNK